MALTVRLTPTEKRLLDLLADGDPKPPEKIQDVIGDDCDWNNALMHIKNLRAKVNADGYDIAHRVRNRCVYYVLVKTVSREEISG